MHKRKNIQRGFTLIELLVVIAIISLLSSVVLASLNSARTKANNASRLSLVRQYEIAFANYYSTNGTYPQLGTNGTACLGNMPGGCRGGTHQTSPSLQTALAPYIADNAVPPPNTSYSTLSGLVYFNCPFSGMCTQPGYGIIWVMDGANHSCAPGTLFQAHTLASTCVLYR